LIEVKRYLKKRRNTTSNWWNNAQKRIEEQKRQQETEAIRRQEEIEEKKMAEEQMLRQAGLHLQDILIQLGVERKLRDIARRFGHLESGETIEVTPIQITIETETYKGSWDYSAPPPTRYPVATQSLVFTSRPYKFTYRGFVKTGWTGASQGSGGGYATGYYTGRHTDELSDTRELTIKIDGLKIEVLLKILEMDETKFYGPQAGAEPYYPCSVGLLDNYKERDLSAVEAELDVCLLKAAKAFDTSAYKRKPPFAHIKRL